MTDSPLKGKPWREFWILPGYYSGIDTVYRSKSYLDSQLKPGSRTDIIHVIEHSAFQQAQAEIQSLKDRLAIAVKALENCIDNYTAIYIEEVLIKLKDAEKMK